MGHNLPCLKTRQDGGDGHVGTVVEVGRLGNRLSPDKTVVVQWDNGRRTNYRVGYRGAYDLLVFDGAPAGINVKHLNKRCDGCGRRGIKGIRWQCTQCSDYDLCTRCYMENVHDLQHKFRRFLTNKSTGVLIPNPRSKSRRSHASGIFPGAKVIRGCDWMWGDQDGGVGGIGTVTEIRGWPPESENSVASVNFPGNRANVYRLGHRGKVDLKCLTSAKGPMYYKEHLPVLGKDDQASCPFSVGDQVRVSLSVDVLKQMQQDHGGWNPKMADLIGKVGIVHRITQRGDVRVQYEISTQSSEGTATSPTENNRWTFNPAALTKVPPEYRFSVNDRVRVIEDWHRVKVLQSREHGNWNEKMKEYIGRKGIIIDVYHDGDVRVKFSPETQWTFNPDCLILEAEDAGPLEIIPPETRDPSTTIELLTKISRGEFQDVKQILQEQPELINVPCREKKGCTPLMVAAYKGNKEIVRYLLSRGASISAADEQGDGALRWTVVSKCDAADRTECLQILLEKCTAADLNPSNNAKQSPLHVAVISKYLDGVKKMLKFGYDVNIQDKEGDTPAHCCVMNHEVPEFLRILIGHTNFKPEITNNRNFNILHLAAVRGKHAAVEVITERFPALAKVAKSDDKLTALHLSVLNGHERVSLILATKCRELIDVQDESGQTPLFVAASIGDPAIVELLVRAGANITTPSNDGKNCIHAALEKFNADESISHISAENSLSSSLMLDESSLSFPSSPVWDEIREVLLQNRIMSENAVHLGVACYLIRCAIDQCMDEDDFLSSAFEFAQDEKARAILRDIRKNKSMSIVASDFSKIVNVSEDSARKNLSPDSRRSVCQHDSLNQSTSHHFHNYVKGLDDDVSVYANEPQDCMSCGEEQASVIFRPCGHMIVCVECSVRMKKCIQCKKPITGKLDQEGMEISYNKSIEQETVIQLEKKVRELQESNQCIICMENQRDTALKCGHRFCEKCATTLRKQCPICRKPITGAIHLYN